MPSRLVDIPGTLGIYHRTGLLEGNLAFSIILSRLYFIDYALGYGVFAEARAIPVPSEVVINHHEF